MKKQALLYSSIIIVSIICGILYMNHKVRDLEPSLNNAENTEYSIGPTFDKIKDDKIEDDKIEENLVEKNIIKEKSIIQEKEPIFCTVYICGEVKKPGVYTLNEGKRINDVLSLAGGVLEEADLNQLNLAEKIMDSQKIYVPKIGEEIDKSPLKVENRDDKTSIEETISGLININTASSDQLQMLPNIGVVIAQNIIEYRKTYGPFSSIEEIQNVSRIGEKTFQKIKDKITVY